MVNCFVDYYKGNCMNAPRVETEYGTWSAPGIPCVIDYSEPVLREIRMEAVEGFHKAPHGGIEVGGVLFGRHEHNVVRIITFRSLACEYLTGPSFVLSERDEARLAELLTSAQRHPELRDLTAVGWYHSHTRSAISLSDRDQEIFNRFFPEPWQVALVVRPTLLGTTRAGFFVRESDGSIRAESSYEEFTIGVSPKTSTTAPKHAAVPATPAAPLVTAKPLAAAQEPNGVPTALPAAAATVRPTVPRAPGKRKWLVLSLCLAVVGLGVLAATYGDFQRDEQLSLRALNVGGQLRIEWDRASQPVRHAESAMLEINDAGVKTQVPFTATQLRNGSLTYEPRSERVEVRLHVNRRGADPVEEFTEFVGPPRRSPAPEQKAAVEIPKPVEPVPEPPPPPAQKPPQQTTRKPPTVVKTKKTTAPPRRSLQPHRTPGVPTVAAAHRAPEARTTPVQLEPPGITVQPGRPPALPNSGIIHAPPPLGSKHTVPPISGKLIWTGRLDKTGMLVIEGDRASSGHLMGKLPQTPVRISIYPADLTRDGITAYTASQNEGSQMALEPPGPQNGWNRVSVRESRKHASDVALVEAPKSQNDWKRLVLRSNNRKLSMIIIEWHAMK